MFCQDYLVLNVPRVHTELGKTACRYYALHKWNNLQQLLKFKKVVFLLIVLNVFYLEP